MGLVLSKLYGVSPELEAKLKAQGIKDTDDLLLKCGSELAISALAAKLEVEQGIIVRLVHRANFARIRGIGEAYTVLLEAAGVNTMDELARRCPEELRTSLTRLNEEHKLVGRVPALAMVNGWVTKAQRLPHNGNGNGNGHHA